MPSVGSSHAVRAKPVCKLDLDEFSDEAAKVQAVLQAATAQQAAMATAAVRTVDVDSFVEELNLNSDDIAYITSEADAVFDQIDLNSDGAISSEELHAHLAAANMSAASIDRLFASLVADSDGEVSSTCELHRDGRVELHALGVDNLNGTEYSRLLTTRAFWQAKRGWDKTLIFQTDSVFCSATEERIENFMHLDFVGARAYDGWAGVAMGGNGGFSLRDTQLSFDCSSDDGWPVMEDALFIRCFSERGGRLATKAEQERFATQNYFAARSLGAHQVNVELTWTDPANASAFKEYCPEYLDEMKRLGQQQWSTGDRDRGAAVALGSSEGLGGAS